MFTYALKHTLDRVCWFESIMPQKVEIFLWTMSIGEIIVSVGMIVIAHLIAANTLPKALQFLQGRMKLAIGLMITGLISIASPILSIYCSILTDNCKSS